MLTGRVHDKIYLKMTNLPISDYAVIGDSRSAALIAADGSIEWLCWPRFDSQSFLNRLLDRERGGHFTISPAGECSVRRAYTPSTAVLVTDFHTGTGKVRVTDLMPVLSEAQKRDRSLPLRSILRIVEGLEGTVPLDIQFKPRPLDGSLTPTFHVRGQSGYYSDFGGRLLHLATDAPLHIR
jgi:GH15 family glucan-1,4-alpha-glucosidase